MRIPNLNAFRMFDAAARHLNFRLASEEVNLTQGAVAQQVRRLEKDLGCKLFHRQARGLSLTDTGRQLHGRIRQALRLIDDAVAELVPEVTEVTISVPPSFASKWLVPRLSDFSRKFPQINLRIIAEEALSDLRSDRVDIAIRQGRPPGVIEAQVMLLAPIDLVAVASPDFALEIGNRPDLDMLRQQPLIQDGHRHWDTLLSEARLTQSARVLRFNQTALAMDAAANGQGIALVPRMFLSGQDLKELWQAPVQEGLGFYVLWSEKSASAADVVRWLVEQTSQD